MLSSSSSSSSSTSSSSPLSWLIVITSLLLQVLGLLSSLSSTSTSVVVVSAFQTQHQQQHHHHHYPLLLPHHRHRRTSISLRRSMPMPMPMPCPQLKTNPIHSPSITVTPLMMSSSPSATNDEISSSSSSKVNNKLLKGKKETRKQNQNQNQNKIKLGILTFIRIAVPSILAGIIGFFIFPGLCLYLGSLFTESGVFTVLSQDSSQFVQNFLSVSSLLFSILVGQTYYFMYQQQEMIYYALFDEVTEAKSLLEQVALVCQGRSMYKKILKCINDYVQTDLKALDKDPAILLSSKPMDDPLETIMYLTSVGVPSTVYETVKSLRQARSRRLGAIQRKLPVIHMILLWILAGLELISFPLLGAGTQSIGGYNILTIEGLLFGIMTSGIVLTLRIVGELWKQSGGAYNVDSVLKIMVKGLENELYARSTNANANNNSNGNSNITINNKAAAHQRGNFPSTTSISTSTNE